MKQEFHIDCVSTMDPIVLYQVLKLRTDVFVVEQNCPYPELDGRDLEPNSKQVWLTLDGEIAATARILDDSHALRIGRVVAAAKHRGTGVARELFTFALQCCAYIDSDSTIVLDSQAPLQRWYESFGFTPAGAVFLEDGIPHVPMQLYPAD